MTLDSKKAAHTGMECQLRSCHKHTLLQVWCGLLTVSMVIMATFMSSIRPKPEENSAPTLKLDAVNLTAIPRFGAFKSNGMFPSFIELTKNMDGTSWQADIKCNFCSLHLRNNSIFSTTDGPYFIYAQVTFREESQNKSVLLVRDATRGKTWIPLVDVSTVRENSVFVAKMVKLGKGDSVSLYINGESFAENTFWGAFQLH